MNHIDLFSGIGGFALAVDTVWPNSTHTFVEIDPFCQAVLKKHWPDSKIYGDIRTITTNPKYDGGTRPQTTGVDSSSQPESSPGSELPYDELARGCLLWEAKTRWDILTGGFPCQPFSQAGRRRGTADDRYLWPEMFRVIREFKPTWVIAENVGGLVTWNEGMVLEQVCTDLEAEGYEVQPLIVPAVSVNAPHRRDRVWIVAHSSNSRSRGENRKIDNQGWNFSPDRTESVRQSDWETGTSRASTTNSDDTNTINTRLEGWSNQGERYCGQLDRSGSDQGWNWDQNWIEVATRLCRVDDGLSRRLDRTPRLKALGNAIVPQVAIEIMKTIKTL